MDAVETQFENRVAEIGLYFEFLRDIEKERSMVHFPARINGQKFRDKDVDGDIKVILKATVFLLLYNLVESTADQALQHIFSLIETQGLAYEQVTARVRNAWCASQLAGHKEARFDRVLERINEILDDVINEAALHIAPEVARQEFQGNLDAQLLRKLAKKWGFQIKARKVAKGGEKLEVVKQKRNDLAHGNYSFSETGRDFTFDELVQIKKQVIYFLRDFLKAVRRYVDKAEYEQAS